MDHPKPRNRMFSSAATGKCSSFRFLETGRPGGIFEHNQYKETCTGSDSKNRVSQREVHNPSVRDKGLPFSYKRSWDLQQDQCVDMGMFMSSSTKAAIHLGPNYLANLEVYKITNFEEIQTLFNIIQKLILEQSVEILNVHTIESAPSSWSRSVLSHDQVDRQKYVFTRIQFCGTDE